MSSLPVHSSKPEVLPKYKATSILDEDRNPCRNCAIGREGLHSGIACSRVPLTRYDLEGDVADELDPVELLVVADVPTTADNKNGKFWSDTDGKALMESLRSAGMKNFAIIPAVRCYPSGQVDHFILDKKFRNERNNEQETALDTAMDAVEYCKHYTVRAVSALKPKIILAMGAIATTALGHGKNIMSLRSKGVLPKRGIAAASKREGTLVTWDRAYARVSTWAAADMWMDIDERLVNIRKTGYTSPRGDERTIDIVTLNKVSLVKKFVDRCLDPNNKAIKKDDFLCFDFETAGFEFSTERNKLINVGFTFRNDENSSYVIPFQHPETPFSVSELEEVFGHMRRLLKGEGARFYAFLAHNAQFETGIAKAFFDVWIGEGGGKPILDSLILAYLHNENRHKKGIKSPYALETLAREYLGFRWYAESKMKSKRDRLIDEPLADVNEYVGMDSAVTARLTNQIIDWMKDEKTAADLLNVADKIYGEATLYTTDMKMTGQEIDIELLLKLRAKDSSITHRIAEIKREFANSPKVKKAIAFVNKNKNKGRGNVRPLFKTTSTTATRQFDLNSPEHRKALFWHVLRLKGADTSVNRAFQDKYKERQPLVAMFQEYQQLSKLDSAYLSPIAEYVQNSDDGRLHPSFNLTRTTSGRLSASDPNCFDQHTETLTCRGWVMFPELTEDDEVAQWQPESDTIDFVVPDDITVADYDGDMISIQNSHVDLVVTPNHMCPVISPANGAIKTFLASEYPVGSTYKQPQATHWKGGSRSLSEAEIAIICATQADGSWYRDVKKIATDWHFNEQAATEWDLHKQRKVDRLKWALNEYDAAYPDRPKGEKGTRLYASSRGILDLVEGAIGSEKMFTSEWIISLDRATLDLFVNEINFWNGGYARNTQYTSTIKQNVDAVQVALVLSGIRATVNERKGRNVCNIWTIQQTNSRGWSSTRYIKSKRVPTDGTIYCVSVPSSYILVRRNGKVSIVSNTQQVPRGDTKDKKQIKSLYTVPPGKAMVQVDFSQAEVRWLGIMSGDKNLAARYQKAEELENALRQDPTNKKLQRAVKIEGDLHMSTAIDMYGLDPAKVVDPETGDHTDAAKLERQKAKAVCFGLIYGKHFISLAKDLGITNEEAEEAVNKWLGQFPEAAAWLKNIDNTIEDTCVSISPFGRRRRLPEAAASDRSVANRAKRQARNTPIQSAASDFCIYAACKLRKALRNHPNPKLSEETKLINTVHDSLAAEVPNDPEVVEMYMQLAKDIFTDPNLIKKDFRVKITVPLKVDFDIGLNWGNVVGVNIDRNEIEEALFDTEVLRSQPPGTLLKELKGKGLLYAELE